MERIKSLPSTVKKAKRECRDCRAVSRSGWRVGLTEGFGQQVLDELGVVSDVQHAVDAGVHQLLLVVVQVLRHVLGHKHDVALHVHHEKEAVQGLCGTTTR